MITKNEYKIIELMLQRKECGIEDLRKILSVNKYVIKNMINSLNTTFKFFGFKNKIEIKNEKVFVDKTFSLEWLQNSDKIGNQNVYDQGIRIIVDILLITISKGKYITISDLEAISNVSKNTVLSDLKKMNGKLKEYDLYIKNNRTKGYYFQGNLSNRLRILVYSISKILTEPFGENTIRSIFEHMNLKLEKHALMEFLNDAEKKYDIHFVYDRVLQFVYAILSLNYIYMKEEELEINNYISIRTGDFAKEICNYLDIKKSLSNFVETLIISSITGISFEKSNEYFLNLTKKIIEESEKYTAVSFVDKNILLEQLYDHLVPAFYRIQNNIPIKNEIEEIIKIEYRSLFSLIKKSLKPLEIELKKGIPDSEIAYFTIHFGGYLSLNEEKLIRRIKALILCPNGVTSSVLLKSELSILFKDFSFDLSNNFKELHEDDYDVIFSTHVVGLKKKYFIVKPLMNIVEKKLLKKSVFFELGIVEEGSDFINIDNIIKIVKNNAEILDEDSLYKDLIYELFSKKIENSSLKGEKLNLNDFLTEDFIQISNESLNWKEAIELASKPLLDNGVIEKRYIDAMIKNFIELGNYIVLAPHVAVPHARPENGAKKVGFSLLLCRNPVDFNIENETDEDFFVKLIFVLSASDNSSHLNALKQLSDIIDEEKKIEDIYSSSSKEEIIKKINRFIEEEE